MIVIKKSEKKKWKITVLLIFILVLAAAAAGFALWKVRQSRTLDMPLAYDVQGEMYGAAEADVQMQKAASYASSLCVATENVSYDGIQIAGSANGALFSLDEKEVLFAQNMHEKAYPASITKIMTAILALKYGNMEDVITIDESAVNLEEGSTEIGFMPGDQVTLRELFYGLLIYSGNDAAMAIAEHIGGTVENFVEMMNTEAQSIGATNTHFVNPTGLHDENHYTTVYDIYLMLAEAMKYEEFMNVTQLGSYDLTYTRGEQTWKAHLDSTDQYLTRQVTPPRNVTVLGGKTGTTGAAGSCLALIAQNAYGEPYISIILHAPTKADLYENMNQLLSEINS